MMKFLKRYFQIVGFMIVCVIFFVLVRTTLLIVENSSWVRNSHPFQQTNARVKLKILFIGDSTAVGTGAKDPRDSVAGRFGQDFPQAQILNLGINGQSTHQLAETIDPKSLGHYDLVVVQIGGNDILRFTNLSNLEKDLDHLLAKVHQISDKIVLLHSGNVGLAPFFPRFLQRFWTEQTLRVRSLFIHYAKKYQTIYVDLFADREHDILSQDIDKYYSPDLLHPSGEGYGVWYQSIRTTMTKEGLRLE